MDPACEPAHAQLMKLFVRCGRRSDAMRQYKACVDAMQRELGARPGPELNALLKDIQQSEPAVAPDMDQAPGANSLREDHSPVDRERPSVAVLPFANLSTDEDWSISSEACKAAYDGLDAELRDALETAAARIRALSLEFLRHSRTGRLSWPNRFTATMRSVTPIRLRCSSAVCDRNSAPT